MPALLVDQIQRGKHAAIDTGEGKEDDRLLAWQTQGEHCLLKMCRHESIA